MKDKIYAYWWKGNAGGWYMNASENWPALHEQKQRDEALGYECGPIAVYALS